ncbi:hypothetical protein KI387_039054 [Taxus chinensis]|uniref:RRM domain-containing protein n=1 Tax=Taxus chinensis TaxID=29808 RepID=A0AA38FBJ7_TAXCH|nr:hypothetical protein KI387_039054 [Taxus chinensis]
MDNYAVQVMSLSQNATERDVRDFFSFSGTVETVELERAGEEAQVAFVTFKEPYAVDTALLLTGATIVDQKVCIVRWGDCEETYDLWRAHSWRLEDGEESEVTPPSGFIQTPREAVTVAQDVVTSMLSKGYVLGKDALSKAKAFDESHQVTASAAAKVASLGQRMGINDRISAGAQCVRSVEERYHVSEKTKAVLRAAEQTASSAGTAVVNSRYFSAGALWVSGVLSKAAKAAADLDTSVLSKGYVLGKDAFSKAKAFDESHQVTASAADKEASLGQRMGINDRISAAAQCLRSVEERYHVSEKIKATLIAAE